MLLRNGKRRKSFTPGRSKKIYWGQTIRELLSLERGKIIKKVPSLRLRGTAFV